MYLSQLKNHMLGLFGIVLGQPKAMFLRRLPVIRRWAFLSLTDRYHGATLTTKIIGEDMETGRGKVGSDSNDKNVISSYCYRLFTGRHGTAVCIWTIIKEPRLSVLFQTKAGCGP
jgi:hypothetical protein